jgi:hypothetical protein
MRRTPPRRGFFSMVNGLRAAPRGREQKDDSANDRREQAIKLNGIQTRVAE